MTKQLEALIADWKFYAGEAQCHPDPNYCLEFEKLSTSANVLALIAALEQAQRANAAQDDHINQQADRIESLEAKNAGLGKGLGAAEKRIAELQAALFEAETKSNEFADEIFSLKLNELYASPLAVKLPAAPQWISVENELPDPSSDKRVCAYTPSEYGDFQYRNVPASLFKSVCRQATHWHYFTVPGGAIAAAPKPEA